MIKSEFQKYFRFIAATSLHIVDIVFDWFFNLFCLFLHFIASNSLLFLKSFFFSYAKQSICNINLFRRDVLLFIFFESPMSQQSCFFSPSYFLTPVCVCVELFFFCMWIYRSRIKRTIKIGVNEAVNSNHNKSWNMSQCRHTTFCIKIKHNKRSDTACAV